MERKYNNPKHTTTMYDAELHDNILQSAIEVKTDSLRDYVIHNKIEIMDEIKKDRRNNAILFCVCIIISFILFLVSCNMISKIRKNNKVEEVQEQTEYVITELNETATDNMVFDCPFCDGTAQVYPIRDDWFIECDQCHIKTNFYDNKDELIKYWVNVYGGE